MDASGMALVAAASVVAGAINSVAGGGTLVSFPAAVLAGLPPLVANASNAVGLTPGVLSSAWAYRRELSQDRAILSKLVPPALLGGIGGAALLLVTPQHVFDAVVPALVLFATLLLLYQNVRPRRPSPASDGAARAWDLPERKGAVLAAQLLVGLYGGYFGAGMGIMMLAIFAAIGGRDIHRMNGVKVVLAAGINATASVLFVAAHAVDVPAALIMAGGSIAGGLAGASLARRVRPEIVRWAVVAIGLVLTASLAARRWGSP